MSPLGQGQHAKLFVLNEVLDHLPLVPGSEGPMTWHVLQKTGYCSWTNFDEFGQASNLDRRDGRYGFENQDYYIVVLEASLRDTFYEDTLRAFVKWLDRLSKRVLVTDMLVRVSGGKRDYSWGKRIFSGASHWRDNHLAAIREARKEGVQTRRSTNWRYGLMPESSYWPDILVNLVPGGNSLAHDYDLILGNCEIEEYLDYDHETGKYGKVDGDIHERLKDFNSAVDARNKMLIEYLIEYEKENRNLY